MKDKMRFARYIKLRNHYDAKHLAWWLTHNQGLRDAKYVATEKLHGANFSVWVASDGTIRYAKRSGFISDDASFFDWKSAFAEHAFNTWLTTTCKERAANIPGGLVLYGELFGGNIQKEVDYGEVKHIRFFDVFEPVRNVYWAPKDVYEFIPEELRVPHVGFYDGLEAALAQNDTFLTLLNPVAGNICEGIVIRPWNAAYATEAGEQFIIKKKNAKFSETSKRSSFVAKEIPDDVIAALNVVLPYVTRQRLTNVISHYGEPEGMSQFGEYLRRFIDDVKIECLFENPLVADGLDKKSKGIMWKTVSTHCATLLKEYIINPPV